MKELALAASVALGPFAANITHMAEPGKPPLMILKGPLPAMAQSALSTMPLTSPALLNPKREVVECQEETKI